MRLNLFLAIIAVTVLGLSFSSVLHDFIARLDRKAQSDLAGEEPDSGHPVGATYSVDSSTGPHSEISLFYNGSGMARVLGRARNPKEKTLIDFPNQIVTVANTETNWTGVSKLNPFEYPPVINPKQARAQKAECIGNGVSRSYPYHRWRKEGGGDEWEVWTDDRDHFPVYFRAVRNGEVVSWTIINTWIDQSVMSQPTFFTTKADPPPPQPIAHNTEETKKQKSGKRRKHTGQKT